MIKDLQSFIPISSNHITLAKVWKIKTIYQYDNGNIDESISKTSYASQELVDDTVKFYKKNAAMLKGVKVEYEIIEELIEIKF